MKVSLNETNGAYHGAIVQQGSRTRRKKMSESGYSIEIICAGGFTDEDYLIQTVVFRVNRAAADGWFHSNPFNGPTSFSSNADYCAYIDKCAEKRLAWESEIRNLLGWKHNVGSITQNVSEIFTAVFMEKRSEVQQEALR